MNKALTYGLIGAGAAGLLAAGCATRGDLKRLEARVESVETRPLMEVPRYFTLAEGREKGYAEKLEVLMNEVAGQFKDPEARAYLKVYGNAARITPTNLKDHYLVTPMWDDGDKKPTEGDGNKGDINLSEKRDGKPVVYLVPKGKIPQIFLDMLKMK